MSTAYQDRRHTIIDGRAAFANDGDRRNEDAVRRAIERAWGVELHRYGGHFAPIDWYAVRDGRPAANVEIKARSHASTKFPTVFLNFRKWHNLITPWIYTGKPSLFVVKFTDGIRWIDVARVDARALRMGGCSRVVKALSDVEPVIEIPIADMRILNTTGNGDGI